MHTITATLLTRDEETQDVQVSFSVRRQSPGWYTGESSIYWIEHCEILDPITIHADDIYTDVETAIGEHLNTKDLIRFEGGIKRKIEIPEHEEKIMKALPKHIVVLEDTDVKDRREWQFDWLSEAVLLEAEKNAHEKTALRLDSAVKMLLDWAGYFENDFENGDYITPVRLKSYLDTIPIIRARYPFMVDAYRDRMVKRVKERLNELPI